MRKPDGAGVDILATQLGGEAELVAAIGVGGDRLHQRGMLQPDDVAARDAGDADRAGLGAVEPGTMERVAAVMDFPAGRQRCIGDGGRFDPRRKDVPVGEPELARDELEAVGVGDVDMAFGERRAQGFRHRLGVEEGVHGLILIGARRQVSARIADGLPEGSNQKMRREHSPSPRGASGGLHETRRENTPARGVSQLTCIAACATISRCSRTGRRSRTPMH